jgi:hypothetical protein
LPFHKPRQQGDDGFHRPERCCHGKLNNGGNYTSQIPVVLNDNRLAPTLRAHRATMTDLGPTSSLVTGLLSFLAFLFFIGNFVWLSRSARRQLARGSWASAVRR